MKARRYFVSFVNIYEGKQRFSHRTILWHNDFKLDDVCKKLEEWNKCSDVVILFFKEMEDYELE